MQIVIENQDKPVDRITFRHVGTAVDICYMCNRVRPYSNEPPEELNPCCIYIFDLSEIQAMKEMIDSVEKEMEKNIGIWSGKE